MSAPFKDATNDAVQFLTKHGDLTRAAAYDAIRLLTGNGFVVTQTDMLPSATDLSQAAVAAALEAAARVMGERQALISREQVADLIRALITQPQHDALAAHVAADVAKARDAAMVDALSACKQVAETAREYSLPQMVMGANKCHDDISDLRIHAHAILALRDKPAPGATPKIEVKFTWAKGDEEFWVHLKSPDGKSAGFNLGNPKGMIATALLRAIAGGGDE